MKHTPRQLQELAFFAGLSALGFLLFLGAPPLFDWDEINFAESAREMLVSGNFFQVQVNFQPFWEKPPLFFWMQSLSMYVFGVNEFAARFPNAVIGVLTIMALYRTGLRFGGTLMARLLAALYLATFLPVIYFKTGIIDPVFNFFIFLGLMQVLRYESLRHADGDAASGEATSERDAPWSAGFWIGLATLTKGPVALLVSILIYGLYKAIFDKFRFPWVAVGKFLLAWTLLVAAWYGLETLIHGSWFVEKFIEYQAELFSQPVAGHQQPIYYHLLVFLIGCFPISAFTFRGMFLKQESAQRQRLQKFMIVWFWVILVLFSIVTTKIIHYSSLLYFPAAFLAALHVHHLLQADQKPSWEVWGLLGLGLLVWGVAPSLLNLLVQQRFWIAQQIADPFAQAQIRVDVIWGGWEWLIGASFLIGSCWNLWQLAHKKYLHFVYLQLVLCLLFVNFTYKWVVPKVAEHVQGAPMAFFQELQGRDVYVLTAGYKSYLPYFYGRVKPSIHPKAADPEWLLTGEVDKDVYLSVKITQINATFYERYRNFQKLYEAGGFAFFKRERARPLRVQGVGSPTVGHAVFPTRDEN